MSSSRDRCARSSRCSCAVSTDQIFPWPLLPTLLANFCCEPCSNEQPWAFASFRDKHHPSDPTKCTSQTLGHTHDSSSQRTTKSSRLRLSRHFLLTSKKSPPSAPYRSSCGRNLK